jgi:hypothetical protein
MFARQSTAGSVLIGPIRDNLGAAVTTAVIGDIKVSKAGGAPAALNGSATLTHRHTGHYSLTVTAADRDTVGVNTYTLDRGTDQMEPQREQVMEEPAFDVSYAAGVVAPSTPAEIATAVGVVVAALTLNVNLAQLNGTPIQGDGTVANPWRTA